MTTNHPNAKLIEPGATFGFLTVLEKSEERAGREIQYLCRCSCGGSKLTPGSRLRRGTVKSCGCARKLKATPAWVDMNKIAAVYAECQTLRDQGLDMEVDHIVPLKGELVCGLHVHYNLQILTGEDNRRKSNNFEVVKHGINEGNS